MIARTLLVVVLFVASGCTPMGVQIRLGPTTDPMVATSVLTLGEGPGQPTDRVAMIVVRGLITDTPTSGLLGASSAILDDLTHQLRLAERDERVRAVVIRIDSSGGTVAGSETAYNEVRDFAERTGKPVVASMGEIATSGGYYLALAADHIVAEPSTLTGSIGVVIPSLNFSDGMQRLGIHSHFLTSGPNKDLANPLAPVREGHYEILGGIVREYYGRFLSLTLRRRPGLKPEEVANATDGRVMTGDTAAAIGLVDSLGGVREAARKAMDLAGVEHATLVRYGSKANAPRTAYAQAETPRPRATETDQSINLMRFDGLSIGALGLRPGVGYYLWLP